MVADYQNLYNSNRLPSFPANYSALKNKVYKLEYAIFQDGLINERMIK